MNLRSALLILAVICFILGTFRIEVDDISVVTLGLTFFAGSFLADQGGAIR